MARVKRGVTAKARHRKVLTAAKGYYNARRKVFRAAKQAVIKAGQYAFRDRRVKKREFRALWIVRIKAAAREDERGRCREHSAHEDHRARVEILRSLEAETGRPVCIRLVAAACSSITS